MVGIPGPLSVIKRFNFASGVDAQFVSIQQVSRLHHSSLLRISLELDFEDGVLRSRSCFVSRWEGSQRSGPASKIKGHSRITIPWQGCWVGRADGTQDIKDTLYLQLLAKYEPG